MRILVSAYACEPGKGSEPGVGWNFVKEMSGGDDLTVVTRANNRANIEASGESWTGRVRWIYYDPPRWSTFWKRRNRGAQLFYILWQIGAAHMLKHRFTAADFDMIHHITFGKYWVPSFINFAGVPLCFGPVGGGDETPRCFRTSYSFSGRIKECAKRITSSLLPVLPGFRSAYRRISLALAATEQTAEKLSHLIASRPVVFPQSAISNDDMRRMRMIAESARRAKTPHFVTACRLEHWKAVSLAVEAFAMFVRNHPDAELEIIGGGPEKRTLEKLAGRLGLENSVVFTPRLPALDDVYARMASATAVLHPALHEAFGQCCLEAIALGTPVVCWDHAGPGLICEMCGIQAVPLSDCRDESMRNFVEAMELSLTASGPVMPERFLWSKWCYGIRSLKTRI